MNLEEEKVQLKKDLALEQKHTDDRDVAAVKNYDKPGPYVVRHPAPDLQGLVTLSKNSTQFCFS